MNIPRATSAFSALFHGLRYCFTDSHVRKLAIKPWLIGALGYIGTLYGAYRAHSPILNWIFGDPTGVWQNVLYAGTWLLVGLLLLAGSVVVTIGLVMVLAGVFQTAIAIAVLNSRNVIPPKDEASLFAETARTMLVETGKLLILVPLSIFALVIGFFPLFVPIALILTSWLLAYQFVDVVLDIYRIPVRERIGFARRNFGTFVCFGVTLTVCWAIPFVGLFLAPAAAAGAAWMMGGEFAGYLEGKKREGNG